MNPAPFARIILVLILGIAFLGWVVSLPIEAVGLWLIARSKIDRSGPIVLGLVWMTQTLFAIPILMGLFWPEHVRLVFGGFGVLAAMAAVACWLGCVVMFLRVRHRLQRRIQQRQLDRIVRGESDEAT